MVKKKGTTVLVANRGEVAVRILHAVKELGFRAVVAASTKDQDSLAAEVADEVISLEGETLTETYLNASQILRKARARNIDLLHPGFGFLSEDPQFAVQVQKSKIRWVGPPPAAMKLASDKFSAKQMAQSLKIPTLPWMTLQSKDGERGISHVRKIIGFPCLVKAAMGGGGKGLKRIQSEEDFPEKLASAQREAKSSFGDDRVYIEKMLPQARHIEIQIFGDSKGRIHAFCERDCSLQRRFQKIVEESPSPGISPSLRKKLQAYAVKMGKKAGYRNAGTVEFLVHEKSQEAYFLEINTRLQVEHPVTEELYGIDLVKMQILTALGHDISKMFAGREAYGHVMELRLYAEDPRMNFLPQPGKIVDLQFPLMKGLRVETGVRSGDFIYPDYDPMIAKLVVSGANRPEVLQKALHVLREVKILGPTTNRDFLIELLTEDRFMQGKIHTQFLDTRKIENKSSDWEREAALGFVRALTGREKTSEVPAGNFIPKKPLFSSLEFGREAL